jgi:probable rRNA maturation factor
MIYFENQYSGFKQKEKMKVRAWLKSLIQSEGFSPGDISYVFLTDQELLKMNIEYLKHDTLTDIITFDNSEEENKIEGDIFISIDRITENAKDFKVSFEKELLRVMAHGVLHLCGFKDKTKEDSVLMRSKENFYIANYEQF